MTPEKAEPAFQRFRHFILESKMKEQTDGFWECSQSQLQAVSYRLKVVNKMVKDRRETRIQ